MKLVFVSEYFPPESNAAATRVFEHVRRWATLGHEVTVITTAPNFPAGKVHAAYRNCWRQEEVLGGVKVVRVKSFIHPNRGLFLRSLDQASFFPTALWSLLRLPKPDVVIAASPTLFAALAGAIGARMKRVPFVLDIGDLVAASIGGVGAIRKGVSLRLIESLERFACRSATRIVVQTNRMKEWAKSAGVAEARISTFSNGVDIEKFREVEWKDRRTGEFTVGYVGTMGMAHALSKVLDAADLLRDEPIRFLLVGEGAERAALEEAARTRTIGNVTFDGPFPYGEMNSVWSAVDLALVSLRNHPTFETVVPSKIFEAMACGIPILLAAPTGEATELVERLDTGTVIPPEDPQALAKAVKTLRNSPTVLAQQSGNARAAVHSFDRSRLSARYLKMLESLHDEGSS